MRDLDATRAENSHLLIWLLPISCTTAACTVLWAASFPRTPVVWLLVAALGIVGATVHVALSVAGGFEPSARKPARIGVLASAPILGLAVILALAAGLPLQIRWDLGRAQFERAVDTRPLAWNFEHQRLGLFEVTGVQYAEGRVFFRERHSRGFQRVGGFAFSPNGLPVGLNLGCCIVTEASPLGDGWYLWSAHH